jgi:hypothetical protein
MSQQKENWRELKLEKIPHFIVERENSWKEAAWVFVTSRLLILLISFIGVYRFFIHGKVVSWCPVKLGCVWAHFDTLIYGVLAHDGYATVNNTAFFPLWPLLIREFSLVFGSLGYYQCYLASILLENGCFYFALVLFYYLVCDEFDPSVAKTAIFYLAFAPYGLFFFNGYSEALFLLLCLATFFFLSRGGTLDWWQAGICAALASMTRATGCMLIVPFLVILVQHFWSYRTMLRSHWRSLLNATLSAALVPLGTGIYMVYLAVAKGNPFLFSVQEATYWHRKLSLPWLGLGEAISIMLKQLHHLNTLNMSNMTDIIFTLMALVVLILGWKRLSWHYSLFALAMCIFPLCYPRSMQEPLTSAPHYMLVIFPIYMLLGLWGKRRQFDRIYGAVSLAFFTLNILLFVTHSWVA